MIMQHRPSFSLKILFSLLGMMLGANLVLTSVSAQETPEDAQSSPSAEATAKELKARIKKYVENNTEKIKGAIDQLSQNKRGFIGQVERVTQESISITNTKGTEIIPVDENVEFIKKGKNIEATDVAIDDWLVIMGIIEDEIFTPKRILVSSVSLRPRTHVVSMGTIIDQKTKEITILSRKNEEETFVVNAQTEFQNQDGTSASATDLTDDLQVLVVGFEDEDDSPTATKIRSLVDLETLNE